MIANLSVQGTQPRSGALFLTCPTPSNMFRKFLGLNRNALKVLGVAAAFVIAIVTIVLLSLTITKVSDNTYTFYENRQTGKLSCTPVLPGLRVHPIAAHPFVFEDKITTFDKKLTVVSKDTIPLELAVSIQHIVNPDAACGVVHDFGAQSTLFKYTQEIFKRVVRDVAATFNAPDFIVIRADIERYMKNNLTERFEDDTRLGERIRLFTLTNVNIPEEMQERATREQDALQEYTVLTASRGPAVQRAESALGEAREQAELTRRTAHTNANATVAAAQVERDAIVYGIVEAGRALKENADAFTGSVTRFIEEVENPKQLDLHTQLCLNALPVSQHFICFQESESSSPVIVSL